jgi:gastric intrinsic factor
MRNNAKIKYQVICYFTGSLQHHEAELDFEFALSSLAVCSSGAHVRKRQIRRLLDIAVMPSNHNVGEQKHILLILTPPRK